MAPKKKKAEKVVPKKYADQQWFWGLITEAEAEKELKSMDDGAFLLRSTVSDGTTTIIVSFVTRNKDENKETVHRIISLTDKRWILEGRNDKHSTIVELITYYQDHSVENGTKLLQGKNKPSWFLKHNDVIAGENAPVLGAGNFSSVVLGKYMKKEVAVKKLFAKEEALLKEKEALMKEARVMEKLKHHFIIRFFGVAIDAMPPLIIMELMAGGLLSHLKKHGPDIKNGEKLLYCWQLSCALAYCAEKKIVHRDLAARNCLFSKYGILKLTDFGMADHEANLIAYCTIQDQMPARWMPPDAVLPTATFNERTDVWSFAVTCNEIFGNGEQPLSHMTETSEVMKALRGNKPDNGELHICPSDVPQEFVTLLKKCWSWENGDRPNFAEIQTMLDMLLKNKYPPPPIDEMTVCSIKNAKPLTIAEYEIVIQNHLDSEESDDDNGDCSNNERVTLNERKTVLKKRSTSKV